MFHFLSLTDVPRLPYDPHREDSESLILSKEVPMAQDEHLSPWGGEQDPGQSQHSEGATDYTNSEQLVPGQANYQPNRYFILSDIRHPLLSTHCGQFHFHSSAKCNQLDKTGLVSCTTGNVASEKPRPALHKNVNQWLHTDLLM